MSMMSNAKNLIPLPICAVCQTHVQRIARYRDELHAQTVFTVYCHGESETVTIDDITMTQMIGPLIPTEAFKNKKLNA